MAPVLLVRLCFIQMSDFQAVSLHVSLNYQRRTEKPLDTKHSPAVQVRHHRKPRTNY